MPEPILNVSRLSVQFHTRAGVNYAVNDVSFHLHAGETLGIVGESGSGKSVTCSALMGLLPSPPAVIGAESRAMFCGLDLLHAAERDMAGLRGRRISMIFQDPMTCLNPCMTIGDQVAEPLVLHRGMPWAEARRAAVEELARTGIPEPEKRARCYPHEFSGGMRQRVMIAMALACKPDLLIADEPTTALDVSIQDQILKLMRQIQKEMGMSIMFITHDLGVVAELCSRVIVMYGGLIMEEASIYDVFEHPMHPYTMGLIASIPSINQDKSRRLQPIPGSPPDMVHPPKGCPFAPRCPHACRVCLEELPPMYTVSEGHASRCHWLAADAPVEGNPLKVGKEADHG